MTIEHIANIEGNRGTGKIATIAASLDALSKNSEPSFMEIGIALQSIYSDASNMSQQTMETVELISGESEESLLAKVGILAKESLEKIKICQVSASENHSFAEKHIRVITGLLRKSFNLCDDLIKSAKYMRAVGLQMRIECSRSDQSMEMFSVVAQEIGIVSKKFNDTAEKIRDDSETAQKGQVSAQTETSESLDQLNGLADETEQTVQSAISKIEQLMGVSLETLEHAGSQSHRISQHIGEIVMGIQFHDKMRQRIEHISKALVDAEKHCYKKASSSDPNNFFSNEASAAYEILELQKEQLLHVISEISALHQSAYNAFQKISDEVGTLINSLSSLQAGHPGIYLNYRKGESQDPFEFLKLGLGHLHQLIDQSFNLVEHMQTAATRASEAATGLSAYTQSIRGLSFDTHLTAVNAMIKAKQLGNEGMPLDKLVKEARIVSERSNIFSTNVEEIQELIAVSVRELQSQTQDEIYDDEARISLDAELEGISRGISRFRERALNSLKLADALKGAISKVHADLDFLPALAGELMRYHRQLEEIGRALNPGTGRNTGLIKEKIEEIREAYTMQEERSIHEQIIERTDAAPINKVGGNIENKGDDLGDNIELF